ncbi:MAG: hypothetical protein DRP00_01650 [Candidatus Aenigmatarchaeota archaeon]|nr:MAG: hypothetical protein DRP00_01650 [Candidatus Aenigmarchaeota archaeon]
MKAGPYTEFHLKEAAKNLIALEDHLTKYPCPECIEKHILATEQYLEEEMETNPNARVLIPLRERLESIKEKLKAFGI